MSPPCCLWQTPVISAFPSSVPLLLGKAPRFFFGIYVSPLFVQASEVELTSEAVPWLQVWGQR